MKKSTLRALSEIKKLLEFLKNKNSPKILSYLNKNDNLLNWADTLTKTDELSAFADFFNHSELNETGELILLALVNDKIILNLTYLENMNDEEIDKKYISFIKENIDQSL